MVLPVRGGGGSRPDWSSLLWCEDPCRSRDLSRSRSLERERERDLR